MRNGTRYDISPSAKYILVKNASDLIKSPHLPGVYSPQIDDK